MRAIEVDAQAVLKATKVDGVYSADPNRDKKATRYTHLKYIDVLNKRLQVMDSTAVTLCMDHHLPIVVFNLSRRDNIKRVVMGESIGTIVDEQGSR